MKILADSALPNAAEVFSQYGEVYLKKGREITCEDVQDKDVLIIRSVTEVNAELLSKAEKLKYVGTATAGMDHLDLELLINRGIAFDNAAGSNCQSVGDYILSVLLVMAQRYDLALEGKSIGIVGCGNTGHQVELKAKALKMLVVKNDPPRLKGGDSSCSASLEEALSCDFVTLHVPLIKDGPFKTEYLLDLKKLLSLKKGAFLFNASRGKVIDNQALELAIDQRKLRVWLDVFEGEPEIKVRSLLDKVEGATAHIAGYSFESKRKACLMLAESMAKTLRLPAPKAYKMPDPEFKELILGQRQEQDLDLISRLVFGSYDVRRDACKFKNNFKDGKSFDALRQNYRERRELSSLTVVNAKGTFKTTLKELGFSVK